MARSEVAHCDVCNAQWVVRAPSDKLACPFCGAPSEAIWIEDETHPHDRA